MSPREVAGRMAEAAVAFLDSLDDDQRAVAQWPFEDTAERETWFYTPTDHGGLPLARMGPTQARRAHQLLASGLSHAGYNTAAVVIGLDNVLDRLEGFIRDWGRERGRDPELYYWRVFGDPRTGQPWSWRVGGHHVSVSHVIVDGEVVGSTPLFLGADPASSPLVGPHPLRPLGAVEDVARDLVRSLDDQQRATALVSDVAPVDLVGANRPRYGDGDLPLPLPEIWRGRLPEADDALALAVHLRAEEEAGVRPEHLEAVRLTHEPRGIPVTALAADQRETLRSLLDLYAARLPEGLAEVERAKFDGDAIGSLSFLWAGGTDAGQGYYYRVQGPDLMVECDNTQRGANHIHTVWRDPRRDFGRDPLAAHLAAGHRGSR